MSTQTKKPTVKVTRTVKKPVAKAPTTKKAPAKKTTTAKTPAKKTTVKAPAKTTTKTTGKTTGKAPAKKTTTSKTPAKKAPTKAPKTAAKVEKTETSNETTVLMKPTIAANIFSENSASLSGISADLPAVDRQKAVREHALASKQVEGCIGLVQGELLYEIKANGYWEDWGFDSFKAYVEEEMEFKHRKAYYLVKLYEKFVVDLKLSKASLANLEWSKAKEVLEIINEENAKDILSNIKKLSLVKVKEYVRSLTSPKDGSTPDPKEDTLRISTVLKNDQIENVQNAFKVAEKATGSTAINNLLDLICTEYLNSAADDGNVQELVGLDDHINNLQRIYGVKIKVEA